MNGQTLDTSNSVLDTSNKTLEASLDTCGKASPITSADIVDGIIKKFGKKGDDYIDAFNRAPKDADGAIVMKNGSKVYF